MFVREEKSGGIISKDKERFLKRKRQKDKDKLINSLRKRVEILEQKVRNLEND